MKFHQISVITSLFLVVIVAFSLFSAYVERTPHEICLPSYGISVKTVNEGSTWNNGMLVKVHPEFPIHFTIGMTGCAFSILLNAFFASGGELDKDFVQFIGESLLSPFTS